MRSSMATISAVALLLGASAAQAVVETWSDDGDTQGWYAFAGGVTVAQDPLQDNLRWEGAGFLMDVLVADSGASGGAFVGDLAAAGAQAFELDLFVDNVSQLYFIGLDLLNTTTQDEWRYFLQPISAGQWQHWEVPLTDGSIWQQAGGTNDFAWMLQNVDIVGLIVAEGFLTGGGASGRVDNFELVVPEPAALATLCGAAAALLGRGGRRRRGKGPRTHA